MNSLRAVLLLTFALGCSSAPEKKILKDKDYQDWQRDLATRMGREGENLELVREMVEVSLVNEDFPNALKHIKILQNKSYGDPKLWALREIEVLRYSWRLDECLQKIDSYVKNNPRDAMAGLLQKRRPVIEASKTLPPPLKVSPYAKNPPGGFSYVQMMQAPELGYFRNTDKASFAEIKKPAQVPEDTWKKSLKVTPEIAEGADADIFHYPANGEIPPFAQSYPGTAGIYHSDLTPENFSFLKKHNCTLPAFSPWLDFFIVSCRKTEHADLLLYVRQGDEWELRESHAEFNTPFDEISPRISADGRFLFFASDGLPGYGAFDYYYSTIEYTSECANDTCRQIPRFGAPVNFGPQVNTYHNEMFPLQISPHAQAIWFAAEGKDGLVGKTAGMAGFPKILETVSYRFIGYIGAKAVQQPIILTPLKGDTRKTLVLIPGQKADWVRLITGAEYQISFQNKAGRLLRFPFKVQPGRGNETNFSIERFTFESSPEAISLNYGDGVTNVTAEIRPEIEKIAQRLKERPELHALIEGHTDNIGGEVINQGLSDQRADAAKKQLVSLGIKPGRISIRGWGENRPLNGNANKEETRANRRIEILLVAD